MARRSYAYAFDTSLTFSQMLERLNERGPWQWRDWQSDRWGDYILAGVLTPPERGVVKILHDEDIGRFAINLELDSEAPPQAVFERVRSVVFAQILPAIEARDVAKLEEDYSS